MNDLGSFLLENDSRTPWVIGLSLLFFVLVIFYYVVKAKKYFKKDSLQPQKEAPPFAVGVVKTIITATIVLAIIGLFFFGAIAFFSNGDLTGLIYGAIFFVLLLYVFVKWLLKKRQ